MEWDGPESRGTEQKCALIQLDALVMLLIAVSITIFLLFQLMAFFTHFSLLNNTRELHPQTEMEKNLRWIW